jgi:bifunctional DNA primase/polymerase-like protein/AAA domain-containing protein/primase-like protein
VRPHDAGAAVGVQGVTKKEHALAALARGWSVIPLKPQSKIAAIDWKVYQERRASAEEVEAWWTAEPEYNIGIVCGRVSGIVVGDVDPRNGGSIVEMQQDAPSGYTVTTPGLGSHFYYRHPGGLVKKGKPRPGVDFQAEGSYVVGVGSYVNTPVYAGYYIQTADGDLSDPPSWLMKQEAKNDKAPSGSAEAWVASALSSGCAPGTRNDTLARLAGYFAGRRVPEDVCRALLVPWVLRQPGTGVTDSEAERTIGSIYAKENESRGDGATAGLLARADELVCDVSDLTFPEQAWIVQDFVAPGCLTEIVGKVKKGKSPLVYQLVAAVHKGEPFLDRPTVKNSVLILTEQLGGSLKATLARARLLGGTTGVYVMLKPNIRAAGSWANAVAVATQVCLRKNIQLIVVDTLSRLAGLTGESENQSGIVGLLDPFLPFRKSGGACIFVRHARKGQGDQPDDIADAARGSSAITGDMDIILNLAPVKDADVRKLSWQSRISDDPEDIFLEYQDGIYRIVQEPEGQHLKKANARLDQMKAALESGMDPKGITALMKHLGWSQHTVTKYRDMVLEERQFTQGAPEGGWNGVQG